MATAANDRLPPPERQFGIVEVLERGAVRSVVIGASARAILAFQPHRLVEPAPAGELAQPTR